jgi:hypothetical protein
MSSMLWALCYPNYRIRSLESGLESPSESACGSTDRLFSVADPWGDSGTSIASGKSKTTPPTESSSKTVTPKYDPAHYQRGRIQVWDFIVDQQLDFLAGNCVKYVCRAGHKNQESELDDWLKVRAYVEKKIATLSTKK